MSDQIADPEKFDFEALANDEKALLVSLPYRVGYWISQADTDGGEEADAAEARTLECLITSYAEDMCKSEFVQRLMEKTVEQRERWVLWQNNMDKVPEECSNACVLLADKLDEKDLGSFQENLFEIGLAVAGVYREEDVDLAGNFISRFFSSLFSNNSFDQNSVNISTRERAALRQLQEVLGM